jgi:FKBP-type peptidyl-prolyl cis-trans isomerase
MRKPVFLLMLSGAYLMLAVGCSSNAVTTRTGLTYMDEKEGIGQPAKNGDTVVVDYTGWLSDGTKFDSSRDRGQPLTFTIGVGTVIKGWDEGVVGMKVGGKRKLVIPSELAYGRHGRENVIPPNAELTCDVELLDIKPAH